MEKIQSQEQSLTIRLGSDLSFPIQGSFAAISGLEVLLQDIQQLLLTIPGERPMRPSYGCNLRNLVWENMGPSVNEGASSIRESLDRFEPRITVTNVSGNPNTNTGLITYSIQFIINSTDSSVNLIFPFRAGTQLSFN